LAVGAGSIGDIYRPTERANAMGWYYSGVNGLVHLLHLPLTCCVCSKALMGPSFSPLFAGLFTQYTKVRAAFSGRLPVLSYPQQTWRSTQYALPTSSPTILADTSHQILAGRLCSLVRSPYVLFPPGNFTPATTARQAAGGNGKAIRDVLVQPVVHPGAV